MVFARFIHERFKLQNLRNLQDKHVVDFIKQRQEEGIAPEARKEEQPIEGNFSNVHLTDV